MSSGWESLLRISRADAWEVPGLMTKRGFFLNADSISPDFGAQVTERDTKLSGVRESLADTFSIDRHYPRGEFTFQPRVDDVLMLFAAHFQNVVKSGTGTYEFSPLSSALSWTAGGSNIGTHPYSINIDVSLGEGQQLGPSLYRFTNCIVDTLTFDARYGEDLALTVTFKSLLAAKVDTPGFFKPPGAFGSLSESPRFVDSHATFTHGAGAYPVENWQGVFNNNTFERAQLGKRGWTRFPLGRWIGDGSFDGEYLGNIDFFKEGGTASLMVEFFGGVNNRLVINYPNIIHRAQNISVTAGDALVELSVPYRAYPLPGTTAPSTIVRVYTGTFFGATLLGF